VVAAPGVSLSVDDLQAFCAAHLADFQTPRRWHLMPALPKNPMGKVLKRELREQLLARPD
jgi:acyl-CoA synthetase (AMP-forming)/AMP-acid ligase II